ncbi:protein PELOTA 1-like [Arachis hypogaea]|uniref:protein PELOTA 1-like n=1 Tax=Arachis hypogaea TaxID=3818 RepID=UPI0010FC4AFB|nr:protein PELOTA 1-like [Arachis hypogaea]
MTIIPEEPDDIWILYNIINPGDYVTADTSRKVHHQLNDAKTTTASRVKLSIHLKVTCRDFHKDSSTLRIHGRNLEPNNYIAVGSFHTLTLERNKPFELHKKLWKDDVIEALQERENHEACPEAELAVILFQQDHAEIYLIGKGVTAMVSKVETSSSRSGGRKSSSSSPSSSNSKNVFFREVFTAFIKHVDLNKVKNTVIASEDSKKDEFRRFMISEAKRMKMRSIEENIGRIVVAAGGGCRWWLQRRFEGSFGRRHGDKPYEGQQGRVAD